jgi:hypothetical protein
MKANIQVFQEMIELCQVIHDSGKPVEGEPELRQIDFGELFQIYVHINDKVVGLLLRARKHELLTFEVSLIFLMIRLDIETDEFCFDFLGRMLIPKVPRSRPSVSVKTNKENQRDYDGKTDSNSSFIKSKSKVSEPILVRK